MALQSYLTGKNRAKVHRSVDINDLFSRMESEKKKEKKYNITLVAGAASALAVSAILIIF